MQREDSIAYGTRNSISLSEVCRYLIRRQLAVGLLRFFQP
jgi:hypothetical protein